MRARGLTCTPTTDSGTLEVYRPPVSGVQSQVCSLRCVVSGVWSQVCSLRCVVLGLLARFENKFTIHTNGFSYSIDLVTLTQGMQIGLLRGIRHGWWATRQARVSLEFKLELVGRELQCRCAAVLDSLL